MSQQIGNYRWRIVAFLFFATTINYVDRQIIGILAPTLQDAFHWTEKDYSHIIMGFQAAYAIGLLVMGNLLDKLGIKLVYGIAIAIWSLAGMFHAAAQSVYAFIAARFTLGIGEAANFPAAVKTVTEWFPKRERALATSIFNTGTNVGAMLTPILIPLITIKWDWKVAFLITGASGFVWLLFWIVLYKQPAIAKGLKSSEKEYILQDGKETAEKVPWKKVIPYKQTLGICLARFVTDPIWWFILFWVPKFLNENFQINLSNVGLPLFTIYTISIAGSIFGGWFSSHLVKAGKIPVIARKITIFILAIIVIPIFFASNASNLWLAVTLVTLGAFVHQGFAANIFTIVSDIYPKKAVGSMIGISGFAGSLGGFIFSKIVGDILQNTGSYFLLFGFASMAYLLSWLFLFIFVPNNKKIEIS
jgi:ACS family hexuronate transporter-like MFS transporter